jgi:hypothetical protein
MAIAVDRKVKSLAFSRVDRMVNTLKQKKKNKQKRNALENRQIRRSRASNVQKFATAVWVWAICLAAGKSPEEIEHECWSAIRDVRDKDLPAEWRKQIVFKPTRCFRHWIEWDHAKKTTNISNDDMLLVSERLYPGTTYWLQSRLWWAIECNPISKSQIEAALLQLDKSVTDVLFEPEGQNPRWDIPRRTRKPFTEDLAEQLLKIESFDAFVASYLFVRLANTISSAQLAALAISLHYSFYPRIARLPQIAPYHRVLFRMLSTHIVYWKYPEIDRREEHSFLWDSVSRQFFGAAGSLPTRDELAEINRKYEELIG